MRSLAGNALLVLGIALLALTAALYGYGEYERLAFERRQAVLESFDRATATAVAIGEVAATAQARGLATATARAEARATPPAAATPAALVGATPSALPTPLAAAAPAPTPRPSPTAQPAVTQIRRIVARSIALDAPVVEAKLRQGEWDVPKFVAGHLEGTALPGTGGNVVLSGHVQSLSSGNVFANLEKLKSGDEVVLRTNLGEVTYRITGRNVVPNDDVSVVRPTPREEVTLITCTGVFNPLKQDYTHRLVIWGERVG
jgi:LPXTG-site transpeptidase (sortase) family protein